MSTYTKMSRRDFVLHSRSTFNDFNLFSGALKPLLFNDEYSLLELDECLLSCQRLDRYESKVCFQVSKTKNSISGIFVKCLEIVP